MKENIINDSLVTENFSKSYPFLNKYLIEYGEFDDSRSGNVKEILNFKTTITNPYKRCVGNNKRNINIFFLLAEAMWIFVGRKDLEFLEIFNSNMKNFSDDGKYFHAPYGWRMRKYGCSSFDEYTSCSEHHNHEVNYLMNGIDQIDELLRLFKEDKNTRRAVISIWNTELDLNKKSNDIPCNDMLFFKIRDNKLHLTVSNRSNDLHWGLPTNIFQFSFLSEIIANILEIDLGTQTHNSQSLHYYINNTIADRMNENLIMNNMKFTDLYDRCVEWKIDMNFDPNESYIYRLNLVTYHLKRIIESFKYDKDLNHIESRSLFNFSKYFYFVYKLLHIYRNYKIAKNKTDHFKLKKIEEINELYDEVKNHKKYNNDIYLLAINYFYSRIDNKEQYDLDNDLGNF